MRINELIDSVRPLSLGEQLQEILSYKELQIASLLNRMLRDVTLLQFEDMITTIGDLYNISISKEDIIRDLNDDTTLNVRSDCKSSNVSLSSVRDEVRNKIETFRAQLPELEQFYIKKYFDRDDKYRFNNKNFLLKLYLIGGIEFLVYVLELLEEIDDLMLKKSKIDS